MLSNNPSKKKMLSNKPSHGRAQTINNANIHILNNETKLLLD